MTSVTEVTLFFIKPQNGLIAFASLILDDQLYLDGISIRLRIELSIPKLLFGNNFEEVDNYHFDQIVDTLQTRLREMSVWVEKDALIDASVSSIHYGKNMVLTDYTSCSMVMTEIGKIDMTRRLDLNKTDYRNTGHCVRYHANSYELAFYDKIKDLKQSRTSEKRATEKDNLIQRDLFDFADEKSLPEVLRMEARLGSRKKIQSLLAKFGQTPALTFKNMFDSMLSKIVLLHFWDIIAKDMAILALAQQKPEDLLQALADCGQGQRKMAKNLQMVGLAVTLNAIGWRGLKAIGSDKASIRALQRAKKDLENMPLTSNMRYAAMCHIEQKLHEFKAIRMDDLIGLKTKKAWEGYDSRSSTDALHHALYPHNDTKTGICQ